MPYLAHPDGTPATKESVVALLVSEKISCNHQRDKAGDRGTRVHQAFEDWAKTERLPDPEDFNEEDAGYVRGLVRFLEEVQPRPRACEVMVGSLRNGYAGRYDLRAYVERARSVVYKRTPKRGAQYAELQPGSLLIDLKTSKGAYVSHHLQLAAYEGASIECGYDATDAQGILVVSPEGHYEFHRSNAKLDDFLAVKSAYDALERLKAVKK